MPLPLGPRSSSASPFAERERDAGEDTPSGADAGELIGDEQGAAQSTGRRSSITLPSLASSPGPTSVTLPRRPVIARRLSSIAAARPSPCWADLAVQGHLVATVEALDHQPGATDLAMPLGDPGDLGGMHEHALDLGALIGPPEPAAQPPVGPSAGAHARHDGRKIAGRKADQRVVGIERGHHHLADLAGRHRLAGARAAPPRPARPRRSPGRRGPRSRRRSGRCRRSHSTGRRRRRAASCSSSASARGKASPETRAWRRQSIRRPSARPRSSRMRRNEGVPAKAAGCRRSITCSCRSVWPVPAGITGQPSARAPLSIIEPPGVR